MPATPKGYEDVVLAAPVTVPYVRHSPRNAHSFAARALSRLLRDTSLEKTQIDGLCIASFTLAPDTAVGLTQHLGLSLRWLDYLPLGGASGIVAIRRALRAVQAGDAQIVACIGADTHHAESFRTTLENFSTFARDAVLPYGFGGPNANFALLTDYYMRTYGARREDFGKLCVEQRASALTYPFALLRKPLSLEEYLNARPIAEPLCLFDCVMPCAGAEGLLVMREARARALRLPYVRVLSSCERHNAFAEDPIQMRGGWALDRELLFASAGVEPDDIDVVETYDDYPVMTLIQLEDLGFCAKGAAPSLVRSNSFTAEGTFPLNTCGGQLSVGQAGCAGGFLGLIEAVRQLTDQNLAHPVPGARFAVVSGYGMITYDRGLCAGAAVLARSIT